MVAAIALAGAANVMAAGDTPQNVASEGMSLQAKIAKSCKITGSDVWYGYRRTKFNFNGRKAWVVEPSVAPANSERNIFFICLEKSCATSPEPVY